MCGIIGQVGLQKENKTQSMALSKLHHRGPDAVGNWRADNVWFGHHRLSINDLTDNANQPMHNEDNTIHLVCNGEIYNYKTLRTELEAAGHTFTTNCDSEVILHAYEAWGENCVNHFQGMFAFALWDENKGELFCARDHVGIKPLYYFQDNDSLTFASELSGCLNLNTQQPEINPKSIAHFLTLGYIPAPLTIWKGIQKLLPGHTLKFDLSGKLAINQFWEPPRKIIEDNEQSWDALFEDVLDEHLLSDVPVGLFLSGGLDSSAVCLGLSRLNQKVDTLTVGYPESERDESDIANRLAKHLSFNNTFLAIESSDVDTLLNQTTEAFDEPQGYSALLSMQSICQVGAEHHKVILSGDGGDEVLGGYNWYRLLDRSLPQKAKDILSKVSNSLAEDSIEKDINTFIQKSTLHQHAWHLYPRFLPEEVESLLEPSGLGKFDDEAMLAPLKKHFEPDLPLQRALQRIDLMTFCSDSILPKVDRASMNHSLEIRVPFLDKRLIEWGITRPIEKSEQTTGKNVLRNYLAKNVPDEVLDHPKQGFSLAVLDKLNWDKAIEEIEDGYWVQKNFIRSDWKNIITREHPYKEARIWNLLVLTRWAKHWITP